MPITLPRTTALEHHTDPNRADMSTGILFVKKRPTAANPDRTERVSYDKITTRIRKLCYGLNMDFVDPAQISWKVIQGIYRGVTTCELDNLAAETCAMMSTVHPDYGTLAGRIFTNNLHKETEKVFSKVVENLFHHVHPKTGEEMPLVSKQFHDDVMANKDELNSAIIYDRDYSYSFFGLKTLEKAYLLRIGGKVAERPQHLLMRVAVALHGRNLEKVLETYSDLSLRYFIHATPTLFNAGTMRAGLSSCFLLTATPNDDSIENLSQLTTDCNIISKYSGGIGLSIHDVRAKGSLIKSTNGMSEGIIPYLRVLNANTRWVTQSNKRPGSIAIYLEPWHAEIREFLKLKENAGADEFRARDLFYGLWIPDLFMKKARSEDRQYQLWCLFCPNEAPGLADVYGDEFEALYDRYEREGRYRTKISARDLIYEIIESQIKTGGPYMLYKDSVNKKNNQKHMGTVRGSNLCVAPETRILTDKGYREIGKLRDKVVKVWNGTRFSETTVQRTSERSELVKVTFSNGSVLECTEYHKFYLQPGYNKKQVVIKEAKDLLPDDKLVKVDFPVIREGSATAPFKYAYTAGFFCGDGTYSRAATKQSQCTYKKAFGTHYCKKHQAFQHHTELPEDLERCHALINKTMPILALYGEKKELVQSIDNYKTFQDGAGRTICFLPYDLPTKYQVPLDHDLDTRLRFFEGLCDSDGTAPKADIIPTTSIQITSTHPKFMEEVKMMLQTMGVDAKVCKGNEERVAALPDGRGSHKDVQCKKTVRLLLTSLQVRALQDLGFAPKRLQLATEIAQKETKRYVKVLSVERTGRHDATYCFNEPLEHRGIFNGVVAGNCCEISTYTSSDEISVCDINSIGLPSYVKASKRGSKPSFDFQLLHDKAKVATKNLDRVVELTHYPVSRAKYSNMRHRPIGVGVSGLADTFSLMRIPFDSPEASKLNKEIFETIYHAAVEASCELAAELGPYETYEGSEFSKGKFQWNLWEEASGKPVVHSGLWDWDALREKVHRYGMRNSLLTAPMPTASTSQIIGFNEAFEPYNSNIYKRQTLSGEFQVINKYLLNDLCDLGIWTDELKQKIIQNRGSVQGIEEIPQDIQRLYKTTWETSQKVIINMAADRGPYVDQSQSMNIFMQAPTFEKLSAMHFYGWEKGLKTGMYYLKMKPAAAPIQFSVDKGNKRERVTDESPSDVKRQYPGRNPPAAEPAPQPQVSSRPQAVRQSRQDEPQQKEQLENETIEFCTMEEGCQSCSA